MEKSLNMNREQSKSAADLLDKGTKIERGISSPDGKSTDIGSLNDLSQTLENSAISDTVDTVEPRHLAKKVNRSR